MRLSKDGLTPISMHGMKDWFRDNLKLTNKIIGSFDARASEYNISLTYGSSAHLGTSKWFSVIFKSAHCNCPGNYYIYQY